MPQSIAAHSDFTSASWTMTILATGVEEITVDNTQTTGAITSQTVASQTYTNNSVTYVAGTSYTSDINFLTIDQSFTTIENTSTLQSPSLLCSILGSSSITFSISSYQSSVPSFISIDSSTGILSITAPEVSTDTDYYFYISSTITGVSSPIQKLIRLTILN